MTVLHNILFTLVMVTLTKVNMWMQLPEELTDLIDTKLAREHKIVVTVLMTSSRGFLLAPHHPFHSRAGC